MQGRSIGIIAFVVAAVPTGCGSDVPVGVVPSDSGTGTSDTGMPEADGGDARTDASDAAIVRDDGGTPLPLERVVITANKMWTLRGDLVARVRVMLYQDYWRRDEGSWTTLETFSGCRVERGTSGDGIAPTSIDLGPDTVRLRVDAGAWMDVPPLGEESRNPVYTLELPTVPEGGTETLVEVNLPGRATIRRSFTWPANLTLAAPPLHDDAPDPGDAPQRSVHHEPGSDLRIDWTEKSRGAGDMKFLVSGTFAEDPAESATIRCDRSYTDGSVTVPWRVFKDHFLLADDNWPTSLLINTPRSEEENTDDVTVWLRVRAFAPTAWIWVKSDF